MGDIFGIHAAIQGAVETYLRCARGTGRTTNLIEALQNGDCVCFISQAEAEHVKRKCKSRGVEIETEVVNPLTPERIFNREHYQKRYILDHRWVEEYYRNRIKDVSKDIQFFQEEKSSHNQADVRTEIGDRELRKWLI